MNSINPKILIISEFFEAGDAVTTLSLFSRWDKNNLFCASRELNNHSSSFCSSYTLGKKEIKYIFPINIIKRIPNGGVLKEVSSTKENRIINRRYFDTIIESILKFLGIIQYVYKFKISDDFDRWIERIRPDYIYTAICSIYMARFIKLLMIKYPNIKFIIHNYDDWTEPPYFSINKLAKQESRRLLKYIVSKSEICLAISEYMSREYSNKYGKPFCTFTNSVPKINLPAIEANKRDGYKITYIGKIQGHNFSTILNTAKAIEYVNSIKGKDYNIKFEIYSNINIEQTNTIMSACNSCNIISWINHNEIINVLSKSDILLLPISFDKSVVKYVKYSMSTKIAEYLSVAIPILYIGPENIAMTNFFVKNGCAMVLNDGNSHCISNAIIKLLEDKSYTDKLVSNANKAFNEQFDQNRISNEFYRIIFENFSK